MDLLQLLVPVDGTDFSLRIEPQVRKLFPPERWRLQLLHVARIPAAGPLPGYEPALVGADYRLYMYGYEMPGAELHPLNTEKELEQFRSDLEQQLQDEVELFERQGFEVSATVHFGDPAQAIATYAEESGADAIAMATHHRRGLDRLIHGSVAKRVLDQVTVPTLLMSIDDDEEGAMDDREGMDRNRNRMDGDARAQSAADARSGVSRDDNVVTPAETHPGVLGGMTGRGVLSLIRNTEGRVVETQGSWFPDSPDADLSALSEAARDGRPVIFEGTEELAETAGNDDAAAERVRREVKVTSVRSYKDYGGETRTLVSFELIGPLTATDLPDQYTRPEFMQLPLDTVADICGFERPSSMTPEQEQKYREDAWKSYELDIENRDEWGTARQDSPLPRGE